MSQDIPKPVNVQTRTSSNFQTKASRFIQKVSNFKGRIRLASRSGPYGDKDSGPYARHAQSLDMAAKPYMSQPSLNILNDANNPMTFNASLPNGRNSFGGSSGSNTPGTSPGGDFGGNNRNVALVLASVDGQGGGTLKRTGGTIGRAGELKHAEGVNGASKPTASLEGLPSSSAGHFARPVMTNGKQYGRQDIPGLPPTNHSLTDDLPPIPPPKSSKPFIKTPAPPSPTNSLNSRPRSASTSAVHQLSTAGPVFVPNGGIDRPTQRPLERASNSKLADVSSIVTKNGARSLLERPQNPGQGASAASTSTSSPSTGMKRQAQLQGPSITGGAPRTVSALEVGGHSKFTSGMDGVSAHSRARTEPHPVGSGGGVRLGFLDNDPFVTTDIPVHYSSDPQAPRQPPLARPALSVRTTPNTLPAFHPRLPQELHLFHTEYPIIRCFLRTKQIRYPNVEIRQTPSPHFHLGILPAAPQ
ncbi:hypothetical protein BDN72DRAFT_105000 [Pluteus cervinus]|uniref:Uncharacterized protein n=1 Tax=Pluteus cervinus TaxID=181527 RepID=A0ACD3AP99_9AGAR|nr:hypothetical protein BDN72DRAFT_105000 [Pluteus cervinus]